MTLPIDIQSNDYTTQKNYSSSVAESVLKHALIASVTVETNIGVIYDGRNGVGVSGFSYESFLG